MTEIIDCEGCPRKKDCTIACKESVWKKVSCASNIDFELKKLCERLEYLKGKLLYFLEKDMKDHALIIIDEEQQLLAELKRKLKP